LSEANYTAALQILEERLGRPQQIISAHMEDLLKIPACSTDKTSHLQSVYDKIRINVRGLESLGVRAEQYGSFLIPVIMSKLPSDVCLQVAKITGKEVWEIQELLGVIKEEGEARELSDAIKINEKGATERYTSHRHNASSASALFTGAGERINCIYCRDNHYSASRTKVLDVLSCKEHLKREGHYFCAWQVATRSVSVPVREDVEGAAKDTTNHSVIF